MKVDIRHNPGFGVARITLGANEEIRAESGAMMMHQNITLEAKAEGGMLKSLKRATLGGESFFVTTMRAGSNGGWVDVAARLPGDVVAIDISTPLVIQRGSWLASAATITIDTKWGGLKNLAGGEGGFAITAEGNGTIVLGCYGALDVIDLSAGEKLVVDSGHMVAYEKSVNVNLGRATQGLAGMVKTAEGFVLEFTGPGRVWVQNRNPNQLIGWVQSNLPEQGGGGGGIVGGLFSRD